MFALLYNMHVPRVDPDEPMLKALHAAKNAFEAAATAMHSSAHDLASLLNVCLILSELAPFVSATG